METPNTSAESGEDLSFVNLAEGQLGEESVPTVTPASPEVPKEFVASIENPKPAIEVAKAAELLTDLQKPKMEVVAVSELNIENTPPGVVMEKKLSPEEFIKAYGSKELKRESSRPGFDTPSAIANDIYARQPSALLNTISATTIPALAILGTTISQAGLSAILETNSIVLSGELGAVALGAGWLVVTGYKNLKSWQAKRAFKKNFGKSVNQTVIGRK